jgi:hypothetical protein
MLDVGFTQSEHRRGAQHLRFVPGADFSGARLGFEADGQLKRHYRSVGKFPTAKVCLVMRSLKAIYGEGHAASVGGPPWDRISFTCPGGKQSAHCVLEVTVRQAIT